MNMLFQAHSGIRYLVLLAGVLVILACIHGVVTGKPHKAIRGLSAAFTGFLDLQILLGVALVIGGIFYGALMGHLVMMALAATVAHVGSVMARKQANIAGECRIRLIATIVAMVLIVGGIMSIGRSVLGTSSPTVASPAAVESTSN